MIRRLQLRYVFAVGAVLLLATVLVMYEVGMMVLNDQRAMSHDRRVLNDLTSLASTLTETETGQRGYLLTGEDPYLDPYRSGLNEVNDRLRALDDDAASATISPEQVDRVKTLVQLKLDELESTVRLRHDKGAAAALAMVKTDRGKKLMDDFQRQIRSLEEAVHAKFDAAQEHASRMTSNRTLTFIVGGGINLVCLVWSYGLIAREMKRREVAILETTRQREFLSTTLASIGDAVILTDAQGGITFMNREAERLTRWSTADAVNKSLPAVFHIVNEHSRQAVENPVEKVLRLGQIVGLANHTVLIARDGTELPIDDSAAPIRDVDGKIFGTVMVFRDFSEQKAAQAALARSKAELEKLVDDRTAELRAMVAELEQVSYAITHDMRAPLRAMSAFATILREETLRLKPEEVRDYSNRIAQAAARLDLLIQDSLHYTKAILQELPMEPVDLDGLLRGLIDSYPNLQSDKADISIEGRLPQVVGNESLLTQCFSNLLGNAVKFVVRGVRPVIRVRAETKDRIAVIQVQDNGIGIPGHAHQRLFKMFERVTNDYEGTGIGLAIVKKVVERMGGKVGVKSEPSQGSVFWVELPLA